MSSSVRAQFAATCKADWQTIPALAKVRVVDGERNVDITGLTAIIRQKTIGRFEPAPLSHRTVGVVVAFVSAHQDFNKAGDELEDVVFAALDYFDKRYLQTDEKASASQWDETHLAYDVPLTIIASKE